ncbi:MAG TPA: cytochrome c [Longimicrobiales bacterium]
MKRVWTILFVVPALLSGCGAAEEEAGAEPAPAPASAPAAAGGELSAFELEHGIGPVKEPVQLGELDEDLAEAGEQVFNLKCMACHRLEDRYIGPPLGTVLDRRTPTYVMNMMLNPTGMTERHPEAKALLAEYLAPMPNQDLTVEEARSVLEYLRQAATNEDADDVER